jgi:hypothetical protein
MPQQNATAAVLNSEQFPKDLLDLAVPDSPSTARTASCCSCRRYTPGCTAFLLVISTTAGAGSRCSYAWNTCRVGSQHTMQPSLDETDQADLCHALMQAHHGTAAAAVTHCRGACLPQTVYACDPGLDWQRQHRLYMTCRNWGATAACTREPKAHL